MTAGAGEVRQHVRGALDRLLTLTEQTPALIECCPPLTDAIARLTHVLVLLDGEAPWPPTESDTRGSVSSDEPWPSSSS